MKRISLLFTALFGVAILSIVNSLLPLCSSRHLLSLGYTVQAQTKYTEALQSYEEGKGTVKIHHDAEIDGLLYSHRKVVTKSSLAAMIKGTDSIETDDVPLLPYGSGRKVRITGYRVQVYAGGNSRDAKHKAYQMESTVQATFPEQPVYTRFISPRWICHVGDFRTREEALELLSEMRKTGKFPEAITVKCKINAMIYEE